jgi:hypothetical protein
LFQPFEMFCPVHPIGSDEIRSQVQDGANEVELANADDLFRLDHNSLCSQAPVEL